MPRAVGGEFAAARGCPASPGGLSRCLMVTPPIRLSPTARCCFKHFPCIDPFNPPADTTG